MSDVILYHGTTADFRKVDLRHARDRKDFGKGFYLTTDINQAKDLALRMKFSEFSNGNPYAKGYIYMFKFDKNLLNTFNKHEFQGANIAWVDYILKNRCRNIKNDDYDIVVGKVADVLAKKVINVYVAEHGLNGTKGDKLNLIRKLKPDNLIDQYCFKTERAVSFLNSIGFRRKEF